MRSLPLSLLLLTFSMIALAQRKESYQYLDDQLRFTTKKHSSYKATTERENGRWVLKASYHEGGIVLRVTFADQELTIKDGLYSMYHSNGQLWMEGNFVHNKADGVWQCWYDNGQVRDSGQVSGDHFLGLWKHWFADGSLQKINNYLSFPADAAILSDSSFIASNVIDSLEAGMLHFLGITDGPWQSWYENGQLEAEGRASHGKPAGTWKWYRQNGKPASVETYEKGKIEKLECYDEQGVLTGNTCSILKPATFSHPTLNPQQYIARELAKQFSLNENDLGNVKITFIVTPSGKLTNVYVYGAKDPNMSFFILRIIRSMPAWSPAVSHNRLIDYPVTLYIYQSHIGD